MFLVTDSAIKWQKYFYAEFEHFVTAVWTDGYIVEKIFGHLQPWKPWQNCQRKFYILPNTY